MFFNTEYGQLLLSGVIVCIATWGLWIAFNSGSFLMGQGAIMGVAGYGAGYAFNNWHFGFLLALIFGVIVGGILGVLLGLLKMRINGIFFGMATLGLTSLFVVVIDAISALGGPLGISVDYLLSSTDILIMGGASLVFMLLLVRTRRFRRLLSIGDDPEAAASCGVAVNREAIVALGLSGLLGGLAGVAYVFQLGTVTPDQFSLSLLVEILVALIAGGLGTIVGPMLGSAVVVLVPYWSGDNPDLIYGICILLIMLIVPSGLLPRFPRRGDLGYLRGMVTQGRSGAVAPVATEIGAGPASPEAGSPAGPETDSPRTRS